MEGKMPYPVYTGADDRGKIERISAYDITPIEFGQKYIKRGMPVVVTNAMDAWPAFKEGERKWSIDWFTKNYGEVRPGTGIDTSGIKEYMSMSDYLGKFDEYAQVRQARGFLNVPDLHTSSYMNWFEVHAPSYKNWCHCVFVHILAYK